MTTRQFRVLVPVSREFLLASPSLAEETAAMVIREKLTGELVGPRGGKYEPFGAIEFTDGEAGADFIQNQRSFMGRRWAKYVRPKR